MKKKDQIFGAAAVIFCTAAVIAVNIAWIALVVKVVQCSTTGG